MATIGSLVVHLAANTGAFAAGMKKAESNVLSLKSTVAGAKSTVASLGGAMAAVGFGIGGLFAAKGAIHAFAEEQDAIAQLNATLAATQGAAGLSSDAIRGMASDLQNTTTFADDATIKAASLLATFSNVKGDIFKGAIVAAQDFATKTGKDLPDAAMMLGKALNDPEKGLVKLEKAVGGLSAAQKSNIQDMIASGNTMGAQRAILDALSDRFGGSAAAAAGTFNGKMMQLQNAAGDLAETFGRMLVPFVGGLAEAATWLAKSQGAFKVMAAAAGFAAGALVAYRAIALATTVANIALQGSMGPAGWASIAVGTIAAGAAIAALNSSMGSYDESVKTATASVKELGEATANVKAVSPHMATAEINKSSFAGMEDLRKELSQIDMTDAEKKADDFRRKMIEVMNANAASYDAMDARQQQQFKTRMTEIQDQYTAKAKEIEAANQERKVMEKLKELAKENADFGKSASQKKVEELKAMQGITSEQVRWAEAQQKAIEAKEHEKKLQEEIVKKNKELQDQAAKVAKDTITPLEKYKATLEELGRLRVGGFIKDDKTLNRGKVDAFGDYRSEQMKAYNPTAFLERGSQGLASAVNKSQMDPLNKLDQTARLQLTEAIKQTEYAKTTSEVLSRVRTAGLGAGV